VILPFPRDDVVIVPYQSSVLIHTYKPHLPPAPIMINPGKCPPVLDFSNCRRAFFKSYAIISRDAIYRVSLAFLGFWVPTKTR
jgi:hypothetical protein